MWYKKILAVIPARAGSKGLPGKNYKKLLDIPLFWWSVKAALNSKYVSKVVVSSNCDECKKVYEEEVSKAKELGFVAGETIWIQRPEDICTSTSKSEEALLHALKQFDEEFDSVIMLQPTSPCRLNNLLDQTIKMYYNAEADSLLTATKDTPFLWQKKENEWVYTVDKNGCCNRKMRQEFSENEFIWHDNGNIYITDTKILKTTGCRIGEKPYIYETSGMDCLQIDTEFDFELIEKMAEARKLNSLI